MAFLVKGRKEDLRCVAEELGKQPAPDAKIVELKELIMANKHYEVEFVSLLLDTIIEERQEKEVKRLKSEKRTSEREFELKELRMAKSNEMRKSKTEVAMTDYNYGIEFTKLMPKFNASGLENENDIRTDSQVGGRQNLNSEIERGVNLQKDLVCLVKEVPEKRKTLSNIDDIYKAEGEAECYADENLLDLVRLFEEVSEKGKIISSIDDIYKTEEEAECYADENLLDLVRLFEEVSEKGKIISSIDDIYKTEEEAECYADEGLLGIVRLFEEVSGEDSDRDQETQDFGEGKQADNKNESERRIKESFLELQKADDSLENIWEMAEDSKNAYFIEEGILMHLENVCGEDVKQVALPVCKRQPLEPPSRRGHKYVKSAVDLCARAEAVPVKSITAKTTCEVLMKIFIRTGFPVTICTDQGPNFTSQLYDAFLDTLGVAPKFSTPRHSESMGAIERWLTNLTRKRVANVIPWDADSENAFSQLKEKLAQMSSMFTPKLDRPVQLYTDASANAIGACLAQIDDKAQERPIAFLVRNLDTQMRWATIEREAYGVIGAFKRFDTWIFSAKIEVISDHNPLTFLTSSVPHGAKLARWSLALQRYNLTITYRKGSGHLNTDPMSRLRFDEG